MASLCNIGLAHVVSASKPVSSVESAAVATLRILQSNLVLTNFREQTPATAPDAIDASPTTPQNMGAAQSGPMSGQMRVAIAAGYAVLLAVNGIFAAARLVSRRTPK